MTRARSAILLALLPAALALTNPLTASAAATTVTAQPELFPNFDSKITDYAVKCGGGSVSFSASSTDSTKISLKGGTAKPSVSESLPLAVGQSFSWTLSQKVGSRTVKTPYFARCVPDDMNLPAVTRKGTPTAALYLLSTGTAPTLDQDLQPITTWYPTLFDSNGVPLWWFKRGFVQLNPTILDSKTVALWQPLGIPNRLGDFGFGRWQTYGFDGTAKSTITAADPGYDIHEIQPGSAAGRYLTVTYEKTGLYDLQSLWGPKDAWGYRAVVREVTADGAVKWSWNANTHITTDELSPWWREHEVRRKVTIDAFLAFDIDHISSARLDGTGVILAFRHLDAVYRVNKASGKILWKLGGTKTPQSLKVNGDPHGENPIAAPHDATPLSGGRVALIDVGLGYDRRPRFVIYKIDAKNKTATFESQIESPIDSRPICCGSARLLKSGNWAISWPGQPLAGEYKADGTPVVEFGLPARKFSYRMQAFEKGAITATQLRAAMNKMYPASAGS